MTREIGEERQAFFDGLKPFMLAIKLENIKAAYEFAKYGHQNQERDDGSRYFNHPRSVATIIFQELKIYDWKIIVAALLHDIREDSYLFSEYRISLNFGKKVALWVKFLTKEDDVDYHARLQTCHIWQVLIIKLCDRLHNLRELGNCNAKKQRRQITETRDHYLPLADQLIELLPEKKRHAGKYLRDKIAEQCNQYS